MWTFLIAGIFILLLLSVLFMIKPNSKRENIKYNRIYAHRGFFNSAINIPENSLPAFRRAKNACLGVELDVQLTKDKRLVVFHDDNLFRMCGVKGRVADFTYAELLNFRLANTPEIIPLLSDVLKIMDGLGVVCEIKQQGKIKNISSCPYVCSIIDKYRGNIVVESFNPYIVRWFKQNRPDIIRGQLASSMKHNKGVSKMRAFFARNLFINFLGRPDFIAYNYKDDSFGFKLCRFFFDPLCIAWTIHEKGSEKSCSFYHSIIFEETAKINLKNYSGQTYKT